MNRIFIQNYECKYGKVKVDASKFPLNFDNINFSPTQYQILYLHFGKINPDFSNYLQKTINLDLYNVEELINNKNYSILDSFINRIIHDYENNRAFIEAINGHLIIKDNLITNNAPVKDIANVYAAILETIKKYTDQSFTIESIGDNYEMRKMS